MIRTRVPTSPGYVIKTFAYTAFALTAFAFNSILCRMALLPGEADAAGVRAALLSKGWAGHASDVLADLAIVHPELREQLSRIDIMLWGHAMPRPQPGFLGDDPFSAEPLLDDRVAWAHVDQTGFALFEEACHHGVRAAEAMCKALGVDAESWISES